MDLKNFYDEHIDKVYKFFYIKALDRHTAEDLTSQTFLLFVESKNNGKEIEDNKKYLYGIMRNVWLQFLRNKYQEAISGLEQIEDFADYSASEIDRFESVPIPNRILPFIEKLPKKQAKVLSMRLVEQKSVKQIAVILKKDNNYVKTTYRRAILSLREMLREPYFVEKEGTL